jgi:drug/metabolite transporter (DMT)-like permease
MGLVLALAAATLYGTGDFAGGLLSRRFGSIRVNLIGCLSAATVSWLALAVSSGPGPKGVALLWGLIGGIGGGVGTLFLYRGLGRGRMSVVGPVSAVGAAVVPAITGVLLGDQITALAAIGIVLAVPAIALTAASSDAAESRQTSGLSDGVIAGIGFGLMFIALARAGSESGLWPLACEQTSSALFVVMIAVASRERLAMRRGDIGWPIVVGVSGMAASLLYFAATHVAPLAIVAVVTSLYPGVTVLLARVLGHERFSTAQRAGLGLCALAVVAIALN